MAVTLWEPDPASSTGAGLMRALMKEVVVWLLALVLGLGLMIALLFLAPSCIAPYTGSLVGLVCGWCAAILVLNRWRLTTKDKWT